VFADFGSPNIWTLPISQVTQGTTIPSAEFTVRNADFAPNVGSYNSIVSFGVDEVGNLYIIDLDGEIFVIERLTTAAAAAATPMSERWNWAARRR
jgi:hypothetical protein